MKVFGFAGYSNSGKTTLIKNILPILIRQNITISTIKNAHNSFDIDKKGKDSYIHRSAGASEVLLASDRRWVLMHEFTTTPNVGEKEKKSLDTLLTKLTPVDLVIVEGFKSAAHPNMEVFRCDNKKGRLDSSSKNIVAIAANPLDVYLSPTTNEKLQVFNLNDYEKIAKFIIEFNCLTKY